MLSVEAFIELTERCTSVTELGMRYRRAMAEEGYENVVFCRVLPDGTITMPWFKVPTGYAEIYRAYNFQDRDPMLARAITAPAPFYWADVLEAGTLTEAEWDMIENSRIMGVHSGFSIPFHGPGGRCDIFHLSVRSDKVPDRVRGGIVEAKTLLVRHRYRRLAGEDLAPENFPLCTLRLAQVTHFRWSLPDGDAPHVGGPAGMLAAHCRTLAYVEVATRRRAAQLMDLSDSLSVYCRDPDLAFLLDRGLIIEVPGTSYGRQTLFAPSVLGRAHLNECPAAPAFRRQIWDLDVRRGERPKPSRVGNR